MSPKINRWQQNIKILIFTANPKGTGKLRLDEEIREIKEGLKRSKYREQFSLETTEAVRYRDIHRAILDYDPNIIHFSGHGAGEEGLVFEDETGQVKLVDTEALAGLFKLLADRVKCVVLNACYSKIQAEEIAQHIPYVIGMNKAIGDKAAIEFSRGFYDALGAGKTVEVAKSWACNVIQMAGISEHMTPDLIKKPHINKISIIKNQILLTRIVNPPKGEDSQITTVWLNAWGETTYILDSVTITHMEGQLESMSSGALMPDAEYTFPFKYGSKQTYALKPALILSHEDHRPISFTLGLEKVGCFSSVGGNVYVVLHYHTLNGMRGSLLLCEPPKEARFLADLLQTDIEVNPNFYCRDHIFTSLPIANIIITPQGVQRGHMDSEETETKLLYEPLQLPEGLDFTEYEERPDPIPRIKITSERHALNKALIKKNVLPIIISCLQNHDRTAFDICGGLINTQVLETLCNLGLKSEFTKPVLYSLVLNHCLLPSEYLINFLLNEKLTDEQLASSYSWNDYCAKFLRNENLTVYQLSFHYGCRFVDEYAARAIALNTVGEWKSALIRIARANKDNLPTCYACRRDFNKRHLEAIEEICWSEMRASFPLEIAVLFLLWLGHSFDQIGKALQMGPIELERSYSRYAEAAHRKRILQKYRQK